MHQIEKLKNKYNVISLFKKKFGSTTFLLSDNIRFISYSVSTVSH